MKKTFKIFLTSFAMSMFVIWTTNELLFSVSAPKSNSIDIPQRSIALFFQNDNNVFSASSTKDIKAAKLDAIIKEQKKNDNFSIDYALFTVESETVDGIGISSIEDAADIPLEYAPVKKAKNTTPLASIKENINPALKEQNKKEPKIAAVDFTEKNNTNNIGEVTVSQTTQSTPTPIAETVDSADTITIASNVETIVETNNEAEFIPIEENKSIPSNNNVRIEENAPDTQIAMIASNVADNKAIEQLNKESENIEKEWNTMSEEENPWVVARANVFAKNNKAVEDFANSIGDEEVEKLLNPEKMEEAGEVQTAEMVKNILIPIPDDIMNDKNLTPQLVSPKKTLEKQEEETELQSSEKSEDESTLLKSITSIFSSSSEDVEEEEEVTSGKKKGKKKKGLFAAFSKDKNSSKILPAEMRLSFQPGRAEISGQTLRWIQAFANKAAEDDNIILEIRIDKNSSYALQQRRLDLLHTILNNKGIGEGKVNTVFTSREPNSFIIRTLRLNNNTSNKPVTKNQQKKSNYQTW